MQFITFVRAIVLIIADLRAIAQTERLTGLLAKVHAVFGLNRTVALGELVRIAKRAHRSAKGFGGTNRGVLDVVGEQIGELGAGRLFGHLGQTVKRNAVAVRIGQLLRIQNTAIQTGFIQALAKSVPNNFVCHFEILLNSKY